MSLNDLTSVQAVGAALDEFDAIGREAFLRRYGFGQAREYFVLRGNRLYDSKAIAGAAHGHQYPERGPLKPGDFSGGEATVQSRLQQLGFDVVRITRSATEPGETLNPAGFEEQGAAYPAELEESFNRRMIEVYKASRAIGYNATRFLSMVNEMGGLDAARTLLRAPGVSEGYTSLWERGRLDLSVEAVILESEWSALFTEAERGIARKRLKEFGFALEES